MIQVKMQTASAEQKKSPGNIQQIVTLIKQGNLDMIKDYFENPKNDNKSLLSILNLISGY